MAGQTNKQASNDKDKLFTLTWWVDRQNSDLEYEGVSPGHPRVLECWHHQEWGMEMTTERNTLWY